MPVADFAGRRNWGYDGVLPFAPDASYGTPEDLKRLVDAAHARGLMVLLDVVYNHFGPEGNYLHALRAASSSTQTRTRRGARRSISTATRSATVRDFFIHNALYWIEEFRFDGLRLDAVHAIVDDRSRRTSSPSSRTRCAAGRAATAARAPGARERRNEARCLVAPGARRDRASPPRNGTTTCTTRCT